jgi:hypothetical protein
MDPAMAVTLLTIDRLLRDADHSSDKRGTLLTIDRLLRDADHSSDKRGTWLALAASG